MNHVMHHFQIKSLKAEKGQSSVKNVENVDTNFSIVDEKVGKFLKTEKGKDVRRKIVGNSISVGLHRSEQGKLFTKLLLRHVIRPIQYDRLGTLSMTDSRRPTGL